MCFLPLQCCCLALGHHSDSILVVFLNSVLILILNHLLGAFEGEKMLLEPGQGYLSHQVVGHRTSDHEEQKWYFVSKIVLTYCEKKCSSDREKLRIFKNFGITKGQLILKCIFDVFNFS